MKKRRIQGRIAGLTLFSIFAFTALIYFDPNLIALVKQAPAIENKVRFIGKFIDDSVKGKIRFNVANDIVGMTNLRRDFQHEADITNNSFDIILSIKGNASYAFFDWDCPVDLLLKSRSFSSIMAEPYIIPQKGVVNLSIFRDTVIFKGEGADLLNCQYKLLALARLRNKEITAAGNSMVKCAKGGDKEGYYLALKACREAYLSIYRSQMEILETYRSKIGNEMADRIKYDTWGKAMEGLLIRIMSEIDRGYASRRSPFGPVLLQFYKDYFWFEENPLFSDNRKATYQYRLYEFRKNYYDICIPLMANTPKLTPTFDQVYQQLHWRFPDGIPDELLGIFFYKFSIKREIPSWAFDEALKNVSDEGTRELLDGLQMNMSIGTPAFDFNLKDTAGKTVTLGDLKGKVLIVDFWYTGCLGCASLTKQMKPIFEHYRERKDVLFVGISIDEDFYKWKESVSKGFFTHTESLNLYTNGEAQHAAIIKHYNIRTYPTIIIIDADGKVAGVNPPRPSLDNPAINSKLISIIDGIAKK